MTALKLEELQLQVEGRICKLPILEMEQLAEHVGLESIEYEGKTKLAMSRMMFVINSTLRWAKPKTRLNILRHSGILFLGLRHRLKNRTAWMKTKKVECDALPKQFKEMMESCTKTMKEILVKLEGTKPTSAPFTKTKEGNKVSLRCKNCSSERF